MGLFGEELRKAVVDCKETIEMKIDGFLSDNSINQYFAGDGIGKSVLILNGQLEASSGMPVFGSLECKKPLKCMFFQLERSPYELRQRAKLMMPKLDINWDNFYHEADLQGYDLFIPEQRAVFTQEVIKRAKEFGEPDWIHFDPAYSIVSQELTGERGSNALNFMLKAVQAETNAAVSYCHHTNRGIKDADTGERKGEDMYGGRFLKANCTAIWHIKERSDKKGTVFHKVKDSFSCLHKEIKLTFDAQFFTSSTSEADSKMPKKDKVSYFLRHCLANNKVFDFETFCEENDLSTSYGRGQMSRHMELGNIIFHNHSGKKSLYKVSRVIDSPV